jgi:hypothetical protein
MTVPLASLWVLTPAGRVVYPPLQLLARAQAQLQFARQQATLSRTVSRALPAYTLRSILTEMYLCPACSCHENEGEHAWTGVHCAFTQAAGGGTSIHHVIVRALLPVVLFRAVVCASDGMA